MRVLVAALGSRGDVEPFAVVAEALAGRGHQVTLCLDPGHHAGGRTMAGVTRIPLGDLGLDDLRAIIARGLAADTPGDRSHSVFEELFTRRRESLTTRMVELAESGFDLLLLSEWLLFPIADRLRWNTATAVAFHVPAAASEFAALRRLPCLRLAASSPVFMGGAPPGLLDGWIQTGFWIDRRVRPLDDRTSAFLAAGEPPFFMTMGSMVGFDATALAHAFVTATQRLGRRAIIQRGWAGLAAPAGPSTLVVDEICYPRLFPACAALFIHGGTGTLAHAVASGRPVGFLPLVSDQLVWARALELAGNGLGVHDSFGPDAGAIERLMTRSLDDPGPTRIAAMVARRLRNEDGVSAACDALTGYHASTNRL